MSALAHALHAATGLALRGASPVGGGSISATARVDTDGGPVFVKRAAARHAEMFAAEMDGLTALAACSALRVPGVLGHTTAAQHSWLFLEWIDFRRPRAADHARMGTALATLHARRDERFGWPRDNYLGTTPQANTPDDDWSHFFARCRLAPQLELAKRNGCDGELQRAGRRVLDSIGHLLGATPIAPCLLHGDLWGGNWGVDATGCPVVFDPAVHFGDPQCDIAMTRLFGGFDRAFYAAYEAHHGPPDAARIALYQLYHVLNHLNLFGAAYQAQALALMRQLP